MRWPQRRFSLPITHTNFLRVEGLELQIWGSPDSPSIRQRRLQGRAAAPRDREACKIRGRWPFTTLVIEAGQLIGEDHAMTARQITQKQVRLAFVAASHDLVRGQPTQLNVAQARQLELGSWCYFAAEPGSVYRQELASEFVRDWQVQQRRVAALIPLLRAWQDAGIQAVAFKGFAMAWAVYPHAATRFSGDVDILLSPADAARALHIAVPGWRFIEPAYRGDGRDAFTAFHEPSCVSVDVQLGLLSEYGFTPKENNQLTANILAAQRLEFDLTAGTQKLRMQALNPTDLLMALAVNRAWTSDAWQNKPHDYLDMALTIQRHGLTESGLADRAAELGMAATWACFLRHCNPFTRHFDMVSTRFNRLVRLRCDLSAYSGGMPPRWRMVMHRAKRAGRVLKHATQAVPTLLGVVRDLRKYPTPRAASKAPLPVMTRHVSPPWQAWEFDQAARWVRLLLQPICRLTNAGPCVVHSLTVFRLMRAQGHAVQWCLGYRVNEAEPVCGHAWVECEDPYAFGAVARMTNTRYRVIYRCGSFSDDSASSHEGQT